MKKQNSFCLLGIFTYIFTVILSIVVLFNFSIGVYADTGVQRSSNQLILPELSTTDVIPYYSTHIYEGDEVNWTYTDINAEIECLAKNIYFEARNQSTRGKIAVGLVTINRVHSSKHPNSICDVVWLKRKNKRGKWVAHFSWTLDGKSDIPYNVKMYENSYRIADSMLAGQVLDNFHDFTNGADHYHAHYVSPNWSNILAPTITVGDHLFYSSSPVAIAQKNQL